MRKILALFVAVLFALQTVVLDEEGKVIHIQDSSFLEEGQGYSQEKVLRFFRNWTPKAVKN